MNSSYLNAVAGAFLFIAFVVMTVSMASDAIFSSGPPETEGYVIAALEGSSPAEDDGGDVGIAPIAPLLASASIEEGARSFRKCQACHTVDNGGANRVGPNLWNIVERPVATADGFGYSAAMSEYADGGAKTWDFDALNNFLHAPRTYMRGTSMGFAGLKKDDERADVIAYLRSLSDTPVPLPDPEAQAESEAAADDAEPQPASADGEAASEDAASDGAASDDAADDAATDEGASTEGDSSASDSDGDDTSTQGTTE
ncbi:MAG: cytochrome c family protein [Pseudomonadota bacterium]